MDHVITDNRAWVPTEIMVSAAIMAKTGTEIDTALGREQAASTNPYQKGDKVTHNGKTWESTADNNVWEPGVYGWTEV